MHQFAALIARLMPYAQRVTAPRIGDVVCLIAAALLLCALLALPALGTPDGEFHPQVKAWAKRTFNPEPGSGRRYSNPLM